MTTIRLAAGLCTGLAVSVLPLALAADVPAMPGSWANAAPLPEERTEISAATDGERLFLLGGFAPSADARADAPTAVYAYNPAEDEWTPITDLPEGVNHAGLAHLDGSLYVVGGYREATFEAIDDLRIYDIEADEWRDGPALPTARGALAVAVHEWRIHAFGGVGGDGENTGAHEIFDPEDESWSAAADLPSPRDHIGAATFGGEIIVLAGRDDTADTLTLNEIYDVAAGAWRGGAPVPTGRSGVAAVAPDGRVSPFGGETLDPGSTFDEAERYDPAADAWEALPAMPTARHGLGAAVIDGRIHVVAGGPQAGFSFSTAHEVLEPEQ
ncbi:kelch repeat-containing protein [soil metagenome]